MRVENVGRVRLRQGCGALAGLAGQMAGMVIGGDYVGPGRSPDRADALVWAMSELMLGARGGGPRVRVV